MGQCLSAVQQLVSALQEDDTNNNNNNNNNYDNNDNKPQQQQQHSTGTSSSYAQAAGGSSNGQYDHQQQQQQPHHAETTTSSSSMVSAIYTSLPSNAEKIQVRNVYDGDTLTLTDERRVRLLGIDTPEIKEQQPYAVEAKNYTKKLIDTYKNDIYLSFEPNQEKQDHYGRLLGYVYVQQGPQQYLCINEGIIHAGYANVYTPNASSKIQKFDKYITLQNDARNHHRGLWKDFIDSIVYKTRNGSAYHQKSCQHIASIHNIMELNVSDATKQGLHPCRTCCTGAA